MSEAGYPKRATRGQAELKLRDRPFSPSMVVWTALGALWIVGPCLFFGFVLLGGANPFLQRSANESPAVKLERAYVHVAKQQLRVDSKRSELEALESKAALDREALNHCTAELERLQSDLDRLKRRVVKLREAAR